ncbi:MAG: murein biosynthesis integral membrane protein MurJ [Desulfovibrio sp.]|nr:murein biosynthesis integral membrane protein MurJ [Desulfovibrio sp.]MBI4959462.1 murein biosynthesis integral membrane protein MurJ [Desulfovibrio sp.]
MSGHVRKIAKDASIVGAATLLSRVLGFFRDVIVAYVLGAGPVADAFYVAYRLPNTLRRLFAEGSMTMAFVPVFSDLREKQGDEAAFAMTRSALMWLLIILGVITALAVVFARPITLIIAPGFASNPDQMALTTELVRIVFPYIIQISIVALCMGALNSMGHFLAPALATSELNTVIIIGCGVAWLFGLDVSHTLAWAVIVGGFGQIYMQMPALKRFGFSWRGPWKLMDEGVLRMGRLMLPTVFGAAIYQINIVVGTLLASFLAAGSISALYYADRLVQFPLGVFGAAVGTVALPSLARLAAAKEMPEFKHTLSASLRLTLFICLPATAGLMALAAPMVDVLFGRGAFTPEAEQATSAALIAYSVGLPAFACVRPLVSAFYALHDTKTPVRAGFYSMLANIALGAALMFPLKHVGLALATSLSSWLNVWLLGRALGASIGPWSQLGRTVWVSSGLSVLIGLGALLTPVNKYAALAMIAVWAVVYMALAVILKVEEASMLLEFVKRKIFKARQAS